MIRRNSCSLISPSPSRSASSIISFTTRDRDTYVCEPDRDVIYLQLFFGEVFTKLFGDTFEILKRYLARAIIIEEATKRAVRASRVNRFDSHRNALSISSFESSSSTPSTNPSLNLNGRSSFELGSPHVLTL